MAKKDKATKIKDIKDVDKFLDKFVKRFAGMQPFFFDIDEMQELMALHSVAKQKSKELQDDFRAE